MDNESPSTPQELPLKEEEGAPLSLGQVKRRRAEPAEPLPKRQGSVFLFLQRELLATRYHSLDSLRAILMLLSVILHSAVSFMVYTPFYWPVKDNHPSYFFDSVVFIIHSFHMEAFFMVAGFFASFLYQRGLAYFVYNRALRILLPLLLAYQLMNWLMPNLVSGSQGHIALQVMGPFYHLWFLYYLLFIYGLVVFLKRKISAVGLAGIHRFFRGILHSRFHFLVLGFFTFPFLLLMSSLMVDPPLGSFPLPSFFLYYLMFFICGWVLHKNPQLLTRLAEKRWHYFLLALPLTLFLCFLFLKLNWHFLHLPWKIQLPLRYVYACNSWLWVMAILGFATHSFNFYHPALRYLSGASYWVYLGHLPLVIFLQTAMQGLLLPGLLKFWLLSTLTLGLLSAVPAVLTRWGFLV